MNTARDVHIITLDYLDNNEGMMDAFIEEAGSLITYNISKDSLIQMSKESSYYYGNKMEFKCSLIVASIFNWGLSFRGFNYWIKINNDLRNMIFYHFSNL